MRNYPVFLFSKVAYQGCYDVVNALSVDLGEQSGSVNSPYHCASACLANNPANTYVGPRGINYCKCGTSFTGDPVAENL